VGCSHDFGGPYWGLLMFEHYPSSDVLEKTAFWKLDLFPSSGENVENTNSVGSVRKS
jgi:hypothetical protein